MTRYSFDIVVNKDGHLYIEGRMLVDWSTLSEDPNGNKELTMEMQVAKKIEQLVGDFLGKIPKVDVKTGDAAKAEIQLRVDESEKNLAGEGSHIKFPKKESEDGK